MEGLHTEITVSRWALSKRQPHLEQLSAITQPLLVLFYLFFITLFTTRTEETSLLVEVNTSTFHIWDERPLCRIVPTTLTESPSCAEEI